VLGPVTLYGRPRRQRYQILAHCRRHASRHAYALPFSALLPAGGAWFAWFVRRRVDAVGIAP
jgi:hypothetical protein